MRIVIMDSEDPAKALREQAAAAGVVIAEADVVSRCLSRLPQDDLQPRLTALPPAHMVIVHTSPLGVTDAETWLRTNTSAQTLVIAHSDGNGAPHAEGRLWKCSTAVLKAHLRPFLETCQGLVEAGWPDNAQVAHLTEASWQAIALRHAAVLCHALAEGVMGGEEAPEAVLSRWGNIEEELKTATLALIHMHGALSNASVPMADAVSCPAVETFREALGSDPDEETILGPLFAVSDVVKAQLEAGNSIEARAIVMDLERMLTGSIGPRP